MDAEGLLILQSAPLATPIEVWIDEAERRTWFQFESSRSGRPA
jgi:hypothetical protein